MNRLYSLLVLIAFFSCADNEDDKKTEVPFSGITQTNEIGERIGEVDTTDWKLFVVHKVGEPSGLEAPYISRPFPAYPNPTKSSISFPIDFGKDAKLKMIIMKDKNTIVNTVHDSLSVTPGSYIYSLDFSKYENGIYRIEYEVTIASKKYFSYGDVKVQK